MQAGIIDQLSRRERHLGPSLRSDKEGQKEELRGKEGEVDEKPFDPEKARKLCEAVLADEKSTPDMKRRAREILADLDGANDREKEEEAARASVSAEDEYIARRMGGSVGLTGIRRSGRSLEFGSMTTEQAKAYLASPAGRLAQDISGRGR